MATFKRGDRARVPDDDLALRRLEADLARSHFERGYYKGLLAALKEANESESLEELKIRIRMVPAPEAA